MNALMAQVKRTWDVVQALKARVERISTPDGKLRFDGTTFSGVLPLHTHQGTGGGGTLDHGLALTGLTDDDHTQYLKEKASGGVAIEVPVHTHADADNAGTVAHGALTGVTANQHHNQAHTIDGADHTAAGLTAGYVLTATAPTTFAFQAPGSGTDATAIHDNVASEISAIAEKNPPIGADMLVIEDSADGNAKKMVQIGNLPGSGGSVATDTIWDAKGDLAAGTGANTASKLTVGSNGDTLTPDSSVANGLKWVTPPTIWLPHAPPASAGADDDEFADASGALPGGWTEFDTDAIQTVNESEQGLTLLQTTHAGNKLTGIYKAIPAGDFTIWSLFGVNALRANYALAGLVLWEDAANDAAKIQTFSLVLSAADAPLHEVVYWTNRTTTSTVNASMNGRSQSACFRIRRTGTTYEFDVSDVGGLGAERIYSTGALGFTPTHYGLFINNVGTGISILGRFAYFRYADSDLAVTGLMSGDRVKAIRQ